MSETPGRSDMGTFVTERLAAMETVARNATPGQWYADHIYSTITAAPFTSAREAYDRDHSVAIDCWVIPESMDSGVGDHNLAHIALNDPAAVLALVAGLRAVVALHSTHAGHGFCDTCSTWDDINNERSEDPWPCPTLLAIATGLGWTA